MSNLLYNDFNNIRLYKLTSKEELLWIRKSQPVQLTILPIPVNTPTAFLAYLSEDFKKC